MSAYGDIRPERVAEAVVGRLHNSVSEIGAYWMAVTGDRDEYAAILREAFSGYPVAVFIVRDLSFSNPNSVAADVIRIMNSNREEAEGVLFPDPAGVHCGIILLGRNALSIPQASSPVTLPGWCPVWPGQSVNIIVEDLTWTVDAPLNCPEARVDEICEALYGLEGVLVDRLRVTHDLDHGAGNALMEVIRDDANEKYPELIDTFTRTHSSVHVPSAFRPSLRASGSLIGRMWRVVQSRQPEALHAPSKALVTALALEKIHHSQHESFVAILNRSATQDATPARRFARGLLMTVASSCQYVTAAAHSDSYARYPVPLLISFSYDLRRALRDAEGALRR